MSARVAAPPRVGARTVARGLLEASHLGSAFAFAVMVAISASGPDSEPWITAGIALVALLGTASGFLLNETWDARLDAVGKPYRPVPSGRLPARIARRAFWVVYLLAWAIAISLFALTLAGGILIAFLVLGTAYTPVKYRAPLIKNAWCALCFALPILAGLVQSGRWPVDALLLAAFFLFVFWRELVMDVADEAVDTEFGILTVPARLGSRMTQLIGSLVWAGAVLLASLAPMEPWQSAVWLVVLAVSAAQFLRVLERPTGSRWRRLTLWMWLPMAGFAALLV
jgi:4-hydroxybenzoate polyprenyltransferase